MCPQQAHQISGQSDNVCPLIGIKIWSVLVLRMEYACAENCPRVLAAHFGRPLGPPLDRTPGPNRCRVLSIKFGPKFGPPLDRTQDRNAEKCDRFLTVFLSFKSYFRISFSPNSSIQYFAKP